MKCSLIRVISTSAITLLPVCLQLFEQCRGVAQSDVEATRWCRKAADKGDVCAQHNLGFMFAQGRGVAQSDVEAARWFRKAADPTTLGYYCSSCTSGAE